MIKSSVSILAIVSLVAGSFNLNLNFGEPEWKRPEVVFPADNPISDASIELGNELFFETLLSKDTSISCQSCHLINDAFADHLKVGEGIKGRTVTRNTPTLVNIGLHPYFMADGKFNSLEDQVMGPINEHREFDMSAEEVEERLKKITRYNKLSQAAYGQDIDIEVVQKAIANFQRIVVSKDSKFDRYKLNEIDLTPEEMLGWKLFQKPELNCIKCHSGYNFTNYEFENNGLYEAYSDSGRALITKKAEDLARFKVPSLRNIAITYPYMHDGTYNTLEAVIEHYAAGGKGHPSQSELIQGFEINEGEKKALVSFLKTLTDARFVEYSDE